MKIGDILRAGYRAHRMRLADADGGTTHWVVIATRLMQSEDEGSVISFSLRRFPSPAGSEPERIYKDVPYDTDHTSLAIEFIMNVKFSEEMAQTLLMSEFAPLDRQFIIQNRDINWDSKQI